MTTDSNIDVLRSAEKRISSDAVTAAEQIRKVLRSDPLSAHAYRLLSKALSACNRSITSGSIVTGDLQPQLMAKAANALQADDLETAEIILRPALRNRPDDPQALQLMADLAARLDYQQEAEELLRLAIEIDSMSIEPKIRLAAILYRENRADEAIGILSGVLDTAPDNLAALNLNAAAHARAGQVAIATNLYERSLQLAPAQPRVWSWYGQALRSLGRKEESITAIRRGIDLAPESGELWWSLADLKTHRFDRRDAERIEAALSSAKADSPDRASLHFALAKALEDLGDYAQAFDHYEAGNALQLRSSQYDPNEVSGYVASAKRTFSTDFFAEREGWGFQAGDPIFVLGMPRAGSTLVEQILGSHSQIEATTELPELIQLGESLARNLRDLPSVMARLSKAEVRALGQRYIETTMRYRKTARPFFVDKMPNNWLYTPLIRLALPNATIVDVRRHPLDCCLSNFKQMFLVRQEFSNDLVWLGRYYRDYVEMMRHVDEQLPRAMHRVIYERLVGDPPTEIARLLDHVGVPFEEACLHPEEGSRVVRTASSDQVRLPINDQAIGSWRRFKSWLAPLKSALGAVAATYPDAPAD